MTKPTDANLLTKFELFFTTEKGKSYSSFTNYLTDLGQFIDFLEGEKLLVDVTTEDIERYLVMLHRKKLKDTTKNRKIASLRSFYKFLKRKGYIEGSPADVIEVITVKSVPKPISQRDIGIMFSAIDNLRDRVMLELLYATGLRRFEVAKVHIDDFAFEDRTLHVLGKGDKPRLVPIYDSLIERIQELFDEHGNEWLFPGRYGDTHLSIRSINDVVTKWRDNAGLSKKNITPHKFRHSFCSHLYENGADIKTIQTLAGHEKTDTTNLYAKTSIKRNIQEYLAAHPMAKSL